MKTWRIILPIIIVFALSSNTYTYADELQQKQNQETQLESQSKQVTHSIAKNQQKGAEIQKQIDSYNQDIQLVRTKISTMNKKITDEQNVISKLNIQINFAQSELDKEKPLLEEQIRAMYEKGNVGYVQVLFNSTSFADFLDRMYLLSVIAQANQQQIHQYTDEQSVLGDEKSAKQTTYQQYIGQKKQLNALQYGYQQLENQSASSKAHIEALVAEDKKKHAELESQIKLTQKQIAQIEYQTKLAEERMKNQQYLASEQKSIHNVHTNASQLIQFGESFMHVPYVWGGESPTGFDCSGFTQYVYGHMGVQIPRTSEEQYGVGLPVSKSNLQPGDLVFFSTYAPGASHVGIYVGDGLMVDSEDLGVVIDNINNTYWAPKYLGARRVFN